MVNQWTGNQQENTTHTLLSLISLLLHQYLLPKNKWTFFTSSLDITFLLPPLLSLGLGSTAIPGDIPLALISQNDLSSYRIVDSGAPDHMSSQLQLYISYSPLSVPQSVRVADGSCTRVLGLGSIWLSPNLCLLNVLFVPALHCNMLSVSTLNKDLHCSGPGIWGG